MVRGFFGGPRPGPLDLERVAHRLRLFEALTVPSVESQTCKQFQWIVFTDPELPGEQRRKLEVLVAQRCGGHVVPLAAHDIPRSLDGLQMYIDPHSTHVMTTLLDDDDLIAATLIEHLQRQGKSAIRHDGAPPLRFLGCENAMQWDFVRFANAPLGRRKPWVRTDWRGRPYPVSAGFSLLVEYPRLRLSARGFAHNAVANACRASSSGDPAASAPAKDVERFRDRVRRAAAEAAPPFDGTLQEGRHYLPLESSRPLVVMTNHHDNLQRARLTEAVDRAAAVRGPGCFPGFEPDWDLVKTYTPPAQR